MHPQATISYMGMGLHGASDYTQENHVLLATVAAGHCPCQPRSDASSPDTQQARDRLSLRSARPRNLPPMHLQATIASYMGMGLHGASD